jgi:hypothetical protein
MVISTNLILEKIEKYLDALSSNSNEHSWRYCHDAFHPRSGKDADYLALQLTVYLASWGMYRGSSGLAKTNYTVHRGAAELILGFRNEIYLNNNRALLNASQIEQVIQLKGQLNAYYKSIKVNWPNEGLKAISPTDTLNF